MTDSVAALDQLSRQKSANSRHGEDVRETLQWLDDATTKYPNVVTLQGADEVYEKWSDVEKFVVPRTLFSENDALDEPEPEPENDGLPDEDMNKLTLSDVTRKTPVSSAGSDVSRPLSPSSLRSQRSSVSAVSPPTSPVKANSSPTKPTPAQLDQTASTSASVPPRLQPLFNYILWRIHQEIDPVAALESFIFLCNDQSKVNFAKGFEIRTKRLEQLRDAIGREDRDFKNRQMVLNRENQTSTVTAAAPPPQQKNDDDDEVVYKPPPKAPAAMLSKQQQQRAQPPNVIDPDTFGRDAQAAQVKAPPRSPRAQHVSPQTPRGGAALPFAPRGSPRGNFRGGPRGRGNFGGPGRGDFVPNSRVDGVLPNGQIDPNSFVRPRGSGYTGRGGRKLWVPT